VALTPSSLFSRRSIRAAHAPQLALAEPLLAPPPGPDGQGGWRLVWSSEDPRYGGHGTPVAFNRARLAIPARAALLFVPDPAASLHADLSRAEVDTPPDV